MKKQTTQTEESIEKELVKSEPLPFYQKLLSLQEAIDPVKKTALNPFFKKPGTDGTKYADLPTILAEVKPHLNELKMIIIQPIEDNKVITKIIDTESKESISSSITLTEGLTPQQAGSMITYFRRYTLTSLLAIETEDDDANLATLNKGQNQSFVKTTPTAVVTGTPVVVNKPVLVLDSDKYKGAMTALENGSVTIERIKAIYDLPVEVEKNLKSVTVKTV